MPYIIQDTTVHLPTEPFLYLGNTYVALREVTGELSGSVTIDHVTHEAIATITPWIAHVTAGSTSATVEGEGQSVLVSLSGAPYVEGDEMFVPYDFFHDAFGYDTTVEGKTVTLLNPNAT